MGTAWIEDMLRLNARILATQKVFNTQAVAITELMDEGQDTAKAEELHRAYRNHLRWLRALRDTMLDGIKGDV